MRFGENLARVRGELRDQLTPGERVFFYLWTALILLLPLATVGCLFLGHGTVRGVGIGLAFLTLVFYAIPLSPILRARIKRRQSRRT